MSTSRHRDATEHRSHGVRIGDLGPIVR